MNKITSGITAGLIATIVLSLIMAIKASMGVMPEVNSVAMLTSMAHDMMNLPQSPVIGWIVHFVIGSVAWGVLFALLYNTLPTQSAWSKGVMFGIAAWLIMMLVPMPMAGAGLFGMNVGMQLPVATLILHIVFGAVLGVAYGRMYANPNPKSAVAG